MPNSVSPSRLSSPHPSIHSIPVESPQPASGTLATNETTDKPSSPQPTARPRSPTLESFNSRLARQQRSESVASSAGAAVRGEDAAPEMEPPVHDSTVQDTRKDDANSISSQPTQSSISSSDSGNYLMLEDINPLLSHYMERVGLEQDALVAVNIQQAHSHPALDMAVEHLNGFLPNCLAPDFNTIRLEVDNNMGRNGLTVTEHAGQQHVDMKVRLKAKASVEQMAGWALATLLHETWNHAIRDLSTGYLLSQGIDLQYSNQDEDHRALLTQSYETVAKALYSRIGNSEMKQAFWRAVQADVQTQLFDLDNIPDELEEAACDSFDIDLEASYSSDEMGSEHDASDDASESGEPTLLGKRSSRSESPEVDDSQDQERHKRQRLT